VSIRNGDVEGREFRIECGAVPSPLFSLFSSRPYSVEFSHRRTNAQPAYGLGLQRFPFPFSAGAIDEDTSKRRERSFFPSCPALEARTARGPRQVPHRIENRTGNVLLPLSPSPTPTV